MWFKQRFVRDIVIGAKVDTIRKESRRLPRVGDTINVSVGPRSPFASLRIVCITPVATENIAPDRQASLKSMVDTSQPMVQIAFEVVRVYRECIEIGKCLTESEIDIRFDEDGYPREDAQCAS